MGVLLVALPWFTASSQVKKLEHTLALVSQNGKDLFCSAKQL